MIQLKPDKDDFKTKNTSQDKERHFIIIRWLMVYQEPKTERQSKLNKI